MKMDHQRTLLWMLLGALMVGARPSLAAGADVGGYFRVMARPDLQGGAGRLGYWNLYGRLLNEGPYAALELKLDLLEQAAGSDSMWASAHAKVEGGSVGNADVGNGGLENLRLSQLYVKSGNVLLKDVTWQVGTLDTYFGTLGLYDWWIARIFFETVGLSARYQGDTIDVLLGLGDSGYALKGDEYNTILTPGGTLRARLGPHLELGVGGQLRYEPAVDGNTYSPYQTPGVDYEDFLRQEVVEAWVEANPNREDYFPAPLVRDALSYKAIGHVGFGGVGPVGWNNFFASYERLHPETWYAESYAGQEFQVYVTDLTDERTHLELGNELQMTLWPERLDLAWGLLYGDYRDADNLLAPSEHARRFYSSVLRLQVYLSQTTHLLVEGSAAREHSRNGNMFRQHVDSLFESTGGRADGRGLEYGDSDTRDTWQAKAGVVLNPMGTGIFTRPSLRALYGLQYSTQNNAFGNSLVETLDQYNAFGNVEQHWHHVVSLETEVWF